MGFSLVWVEFQFQPKCSMSVCNTHNLFLVEVATAVGGSKCGGAGLAVPRHIAILSCAANGQCVDAVGVAITVTVVLLPATVT